MRIITSLCLIGLGLIVANAGLIYSHPTTLKTSNTDRHNPHHKLSSNTNCSGQGVVLRIPGLGRFAATFAPDGEQSAKEMMLRGNFSLEPYGVDVHRVVMKDSSPVVEWDKTEGFSLWSHEGC